MSLTVSVRTVAAVKLAAVRRQVAIGGVGAAWRPALDKVWEFIRRQPGLWTNGHNVFLYHQSKDPGAAIVCDFGVEVTRAFEKSGDVSATESIAGPLNSCGGVASITGVDCSAAQSGDGHADDPCAVHRRPLVADGSG